MEETKIYDMPEKYRGLGFLSTKAIAGHDLKAGNLVYLSTDKKHWFKRLILWLAFWYTPKPVVYKVNSVSETSFTFSGD